MAPRLELQSLFESLTEYVYFQPPTNINVQFPCIIYERDGGKSEHAGNKMYLHTKQYQVTVIDRDPDSDLPDQVIELPLCKFNSFYTADNLNHNVFTLFF